MSKRVAIILSGCGVYDGAEIHESVITMLHLDRANAHVTCFAPNVPQMHVINHLNGEESPETRNVLVEAARIARGDVADLASANVEDFDAVIVPGGFGAAKNLSDFAVSGAEMTINPAVKSFIQGMHAEGKPVGLVCIAPAMSGLLFGKGVECTIGSDAETASAIEQTGAVHVDCTVQGIHVDQQNKLVTTPTYMLAGSISEADEGIGKLVAAVLELA